MTFEKIAHPDCNCIESLTEDNASTFARLLYKDSLTEKDFQSYWDKGRTGNGCGEICSLKGVSVSKIFDKTVKEFVTQLYVQQFKLSPKHRRGLLFFTLKANAGVAKESPSNSNKYHFDFYKSDEFTLQHINQAELFLVPETR